MPPRSTSLAAGLATDRRSPSRAAPALTAVHVFLLTSRPAKRATDAMLSGPTSHVICFGRCRWSGPLLAAVALTAALAAQEPGKPTEPKQAPPTLRDFEPFPSRWFAPGRPVAGIQEPEYVINEPASPWNPYRQNVLKGDFPILGTEDLFFSITATNRLLVEFKDVPTPTGITGPGPVRPEVFGDGKQTFIQDDLAVSLDLFRGQQAFMPVEWRLRVTPVLNYTRLDINEVGAVNVNVANGALRTKSDIALQEAFVEYHLFDLSERYDFCSVEAGILPFRSDFRGFLFEDTNLGVRFFGNADQNKWQYNLAAFRQLDKNTNSQLNTFESRDQTVVVANVYRQDWPVKGYTTEVSLHWNHDDRGFEFDDNGFLVSPAPIGNFTPNEIDTYYLGWAGEGHLGRWNITHALYKAFGRETNNPLAARSVDIDARFFAAEVSYDIDWLRPRVFGLYASGDKDPRDDKGEGFDAIFDNPNFGGGAFSFWNSQGLGLVGTRLTNPGSPLANLKTSKSQGQSNSVNPGVLLVGAALDAELTPKWRGQIGLDYIRFDRTESIETLLQTADISKSVGAEIFAGTQYRPFLTNNVIVQLGGSVFRPDDGFARIYDSDGLRYSFFMNLLTTW